VCDAEILGKPADEADAFRMLKMLSGRRHQVMTGVTVLCGEKLRSHTEVTDIYFRELSDREILDYIATGEPMDKAGSYGIQGGAALFAEKISGDYFNVVGLPVCRSGQLLREVLEDTI
jgi:septum formation protein